MEQSFQNFLNNQRVLTFAPYVILVVGTCCCCLNVIIYKYGVRDEETDLATDPTVVHPTATRIREAFV